jgi:hypothetical protein
MEQGKRKRSVFYENDVRIEGVVVTGLHLHEGAYLIIVQTRKNTKTGIRTDNIRVKIPIGGGIYQIALRTRKNDEVLVRGSIEGDGTIHPNHLHNRSLSKQLYEGLPAG